MRNPEEFCALVHEKANQKKNVRRKYAVITASFCLIVLVAGLWPRVSPKMTEESPRPTTENTPDVYGQPGDNGEKIPFTGREDGDSAGTGGDKDGDGEMSGSVNELSVLSFASSATYPAGHTLIRDSAEMKAYLDSLSVLAYDTVLSVLSNAETRFDASFFADHDLIVSCLIETSGSYSYTVSDVELKDGIYTVSFIKHGLYDEKTGEPLMGTCDMKTNILFIPAPKGGTEITCSVQIAGKKD